MNNLESISINTQVAERSLAHSDEHNRKGTKNRMIYGVKQELVHLKLKLSLIKIAMRTYDNPLDWIGSLRYLITLRRKFLGNHKLQKMVHAGGKYYMGLYTPGWHGAIYKKFIVSQLDEFKKVDQPVNRFNAVFVAITKKCALQCDHCYEWDNLNKKDVLTPDILSQTVAKLQDYGVSHIQFLGGEPLLKMDTLVYVLKNAKKTTDFWVTTSGFKLTSQNANRLKVAGLTGIIISLDHFVAEKHNEFRKFKDAYHWVEEAVKNALQNDLVVALSICVTKEFISEANLMAYMELAKKLGVSFVQFLEPKAVGHFANKEVLLNENELGVLERFFLKLNFGKPYRSFPIITYHGYYQRRQGCFSAGIKGLYVDTDGDINACPFCHKKSGNILDSCFDQNLEALKKSGCSTYNEVPHYDR